MDIHVAIREHRIRFLYGGVLLSSLWILPKEVTQQRSSSSQTRQRPSAERNNYSEREADR
jgi:hypothetical protein